ncbi:hypothetical protein HanRHA438_Chr06g0286011 [Helianthus annuus]|nr:hypothetical protein HanRHA438_Chr06g0286011 [Helianthus annuus]
MYIPKNFYTKTIYSPLVSKKFRGSAAPFRPHYVSPLITVSFHAIFLCFVSFTLTLY